VKRALSALLLASLLIGCSQPKPAAKVSADPLNIDIDKQIGGLGTCVILMDAASGRQIYQYGHFNVCDAARLPPCATFELPAALVGLDTGAITPTTVFNWDGTPQPISAWKVDADITKAFKSSIGWWFARLSQKIGPDRFTQALQDMNYGDAKSDGPPQSFWMGPQQGGKLTISTRQQVAFVQRFYGGQIKARPEAAALLQTLMVADTRTDAKGGQSVFSGLAGSCPTEADGSRGVGWWIGRLKTPDRDLLVAASVVAAAPPPGATIAEALKDAFADDGLWPAG
jgi:beta-lactamase class D